MMKIFNIGLSKTGTNSLVQALKILGYDLVHYPSRGLKEDIDRCDGSSDIPTALWYKQLDEDYPGSKFILTVRKKEEWLQSILKHFERRPPSTLNDWGIENRKLMYGGALASDCQFEEAYDRHHADVARFFEGRDDLLIMDICAGDGWEPLCKFLGCEIPTVPFPHGNAAPERSKTVDAVYPYAASGEAWDELRYSIRSLDRNFLDLRDIWIIGDNPSWLKHAMVIPKTRSHSMADDLARNMDYTQSLLYAALNPEISDPFLAINDDHYLLAPATAQNIIDRVMVRENMDQYTQAQRRSVTKKWQAALWEQYDRLKDFGLTGWNYECHTPVMVSKESIIHTWAFMGYGDGKLIWKTAYFNLFPHKSTKGSLSEESGHKAGFYDEKLSYEKVKERADKAIYLNHNDDGLSEGLKRYLQEKFPTPSRFELE